MNLHRYGIPIDPHPGKIATLYARFRLSDFSGAQMAAGNDDLQTLTYKTRVV
ncbi:MAG TPA: hypothetical protein VG537_08210 [Candidatus Kapabacteria bacterium]|nr:hypothetical protein [Candidatus Kapabacteria bacterium]